MPEMISIHNDAIAALFEGIATVSEIKRASHVEPETQDGKILWYADMKPVKGPKLGPFTSRESALEAEHVWLMKNIVTMQTDQAVPEE